HRSFLSSTYLFILGSLNRTDLPEYEGPGVTEAIRRAKTQDPDLFEKNRFSLSAIWKTKYVRGLVPTDQQVMLLAYRLTYPAQQILKQGPVMRPDGGIALPVPPPFQIQAYRRTNGALTPLEILRKTDQKFADYFSDWERTYSTILNPKNRFSPVVDDSYQ